MVELDDLERFLRHPVGAFLRQRLGIRLGQSFRDVDDALPVELDALERWGLGERLLTARMAGADLDACIAAERARGLLPPGALADPILNALIPDVEVIATAAHDDHEPTSLDVNVTLTDGSTLVGTVADVRGDVIHAVSFSRLSATHRLHAWLRLLALTAARPETALRGRDRRTSSGRRPTTYPRQHRPHRRPRRRRRNAPGRRRSATWRC